MKKLGVMSLGAILLFAGVLFGGEKKSLLVMLDGLRSDVLFTAPTPNIDALRDGSWADGYRGAWSLEAHTNLDSPPSSATNHVAIATGVTATKNNCYENGHIKESKWDEYPTYLERLRKINPDLKTVWLYNWGEDADIRTLATFQGPPRGGFEGDQKLVADAVRFLNGTFPEVEGVAGTAWKSGDDPDAIMLYLDSMDMFGHGHQFSVFSPEYYQRMTTYDSMIGELLAAIKARPHFADEDWQVIVVSDHGGQGTGHGIVGCENCYTIPLVVSSREVAPGRMTGQPQNCDAAAYVLQHFTGSVPEIFDGKIEKTVVLDAPNIENDLWASLSFEGNLDEALGHISAQHGTKGPGFTFAGLKGSALQISGGGFATLGKLPELTAPESVGFTFAFWLRTVSLQDKDPAILSNKDWKSGLNPGIVLTLKRGSVVNDLFLNLGDGERRCDIGPLPVAPDDRWRFVAITITPTENAVLYLGDDAGRLAFVSDNISALTTLNTGLDWNLGQDGTGAYDASATVKIDELGLWTRPLSTEEVRDVFQRGLIAPAKNHK